MSMAFAGHHRRLGRRLFFAAPLVLAAGAAVAQGADIKFKRSSLVIETGGRELKFEIDLATNDAERAHGRRASPASPERCRSSARSA